MKEAAHIADLELEQKSSYLQKVLEQMDAVIVSDPTIEPQHNAPDHSTEVETKADSKYRHTNSAILELADGGPPDEASFRN